MNHEEPHVIAALVALCKQMDVRCVVQVGAEDGFEAAEIARATGGRAIAIEADERCFNHRADGVEFHTALIGATDCEAATFYRHVSFGLSSMLKRGDGGEEALELPQHRLDTFCAALDVRPDALVIDTEGTTLDVLKGATGILGGVRLIYAEVQTAEIRPGVSLLPDVEAWLTERGFVRREGLPAYYPGSQGNYTFWRLPQ